MRTIQEFESLLYDSKLQLISTSVGLYHAAFYFCFYDQEPRLKTRVTQEAVFTGEEYKALTREEAIEMIEQGKRMLRRKLELYREYDRRIDSYV